MSTLKARLLDGWLGDRFLREQQVESLQWFGDRFMLLRVRGASLRDKPPRPGDKVQIHVPEAGSRTFTPYACDASDGSCSLLAHVQRESPAADWLRRLEPGARLRWFGPSRSLSLESLAAPLALFGDETSFGVASAARELGAAALVRLEVSAPIDSALEVGARLGFAPECLVARQPSEAHLPSIARALAEASAEGGTIVLTGRARSIQLVRELLRVLAPRRQQAVKAYWADGKQGLD